MRPHTTVAGRHRVSILEQQIFSLARVGERITALSCYEKLYEKPGKDGPLVFVVIFTHYEAIEPDVGSRRSLLTNRQTYIWR